MSFALALGIALLLIPAARWTGLALGLVDRPADPALAIHAEPVPVLGGPAVVAAALGSVALLGRPLPGTVIAAVLVALAAGLTDDMRQLPPIVRLGLLIAAGVVLASDGLRLETFGPLAGVAVVALVAACTNATNLLDGQNGLAGGLVVIASLGLAWIADGGTGERAIGLALAGALAAFLVFNVPGKIFLGNGGAYGVGTLLAVVASGPASSDGWRGVIAAAACLGVFVFELCLTVARRLAARSSIASGDRLHSYDILADRTGSRLRSTIMMWGGGVLAAGVGVTASRVPLAAGIGLSAAGAAAATAWGIRTWKRRSTSMENER